LYQSYLIPGALKHNIYAAAQSKEYLNNGEFENGNLKFKRRIKEENTSYILRFFLESIKEESLAHNPKLGPNARIISCKPVINSAMWTKALTMRSGCVGENSLYGIKKVTGENVYLIFERSMFRRFFSVLGRTLINDLLKKVVKNRWSTSQEIAKFVRGKLCGYFAFVCLDIKSGPYIGFEHHSHCEEHGCCHICAHVLILQLLLKMITLPRNVSTFKGGKPQPKGKPGGVAGGYDKTKFPEPSPESTSFSPSPKSIKDDKYKKTLHVKFRAYCAAQYVEINDNDILCIIL
jgi:hypothetical protein